jgi:beta-lactamase class A
LSQKHKIIPFAIIFLIGLLGAFSFLSFNAKNKTKPSTKSLIKYVQSPNCGYNIERVKKIKYIKPLVFIEEKCESPKFKDLKIKLMNSIDDFKQKKILISASVYLWEFEKGEWLGINDTETYLPGSLIKVAGMMSYLKMAELDPTILNRKYVYGTPTEVIPKQTFMSNEIQKGKAYSLKELLRYMISYSDNNATYILNKNANLVSFVDVFKDMDMKVPDVYQSTFKFTSKDYSTLFKALYNAGYLSIENSEFALELLIDSDFKEGLVAGVPANVKVAHKFGEAGDTDTRQLHEIGIFYLEDKPYLFSVFTKGYDIQKLPQVLKTLSSIAYQSIVGKSI